MSEAKGSQEPSMEEILASIRRIISEDKAPPVAVPDPEPESEPEIMLSPAATTEDVLELTELVEDEPPMPPAPSEASTSDSQPERLVSDTTASASAAAMAAIGERLRPRAAPETPLGTPGVTLEGMVRDMVRPIVSEWLDKNLPAIVERLVAEEIRRVSHEASRSY
ncbi:MAG TPA: DUF2497 domain-containing protein [Stellaceae bacterium]|nr:DUF2497 domain-containing protein [Stellaceae bacterium]